MKKIEEELIKAASILGIKDYKASMSANCLYLVLRETIRTIPKKEITERLKEGIKVKKKHVGVPTTEIIVKSK